MQSLAWKLAVAAGIVTLSAVAGNEKELKLATRMYSSTRAYKVGDLLTVTVDERTSSSKSESSATSKSSDASIDPTVLGSATGGWLSKAVSKIDIPTASIGASSSFSGSGTSASAESFAASFTVQVADVLDNGVLVIRGNRKVVIRDERVDLVLTGLVRKEDVSGTNVVLSSKIADAHIFYKTKGTVTRESRPGFVWRIFQRVNPF